MSWKAALVARLLTTPEVFALTGNEIEWNDLAADAPLPAITLQVISDPRPQNHDGFDGFRGTRVQVNCLARTASQAEALLELVIPVLVLPAVVGSTTFLRSFVDNGGSDAVNTPAGRLCRERSDLIIWHN
jgi:hypothetical protein